MVAARGWWERELGCFLMGIEFLFYQMKSSGVGWWSWLHSYVNVFNTVDLRT